jgi:hypothetical protein
VIPGDRLRFVRFADPKCGPPMRIGSVVTVRAIGGVADAPFAILVDDGDPANADMLTNGHTFSEWLHRDCFEPEVS